MIQTNDAQAAAPDGASDLAIGAFSDHGPWRVDPERMPWRRGVEALRVASQSQVPEWLRRRRLPPVRRFLRAGMLVGAAVAAWWLFDKRRGTEASRAGLSRRLRIAF